MIPTEIIKAVIDAGIQAPSGDNCQPWRFIVQPNGIQVHNYPSRNVALVDYRDRGAHLAIGAAIQNMLIAAQHLGFVPKLSLFPDAQLADLVAVIELDATSTLHEHPLYASISKRTTNRKPYECEPLTPEQRATLLAAQQETGDGPKILLADGYENLERLSRAVVVNERVAFETKSIHKSLLGGMNWTEDEELRRRHGMYAKTLELAPPQFAMLRLVRHWPIMRTLNLIGLSKMICKENARLWKQVSAYCAIIVDDPEPRSFVIAGRAMQMVWLKAVSMGMCAHPLGGSGAGGSVVQPCDLASA